jgi:hypothetical protein
LTAGLDQNTKQRRSVEQGLGGSHRHHDHVFEIDANGAPFGGENPDHSKTPVSDPNPPPHGGTVAEELALELTAKHADGRRATGIRLRQEATGQNLEPSDVEKIRGGSDGDRFPIPLLERHRRGADGNRRDAANGRAPPEGERIVEGEISGRFAKKRGRSPSGFVTAGQYDQKMGA